MSDIGFRRGNAWFRLRAAGIIVENGCVLFASAPNRPRLYSVGGGIELGETAAEAAEREVREETGVSYEAERLSVVHEHLFRGTDGRILGLDCHEITFYFLMKPRGTQTLGTGDTKDETMVWVPVESLAGTDLEPAFFRSYFQREHAGVEHIVTDSRG